MNTIAPEGQIWVCMVCGRANRDRYRMGDTSCITWAALCEESTVERDPNTGFVVKASAVVGAPR